MKYGLVKRAPGSLIFAAQPGQCVDAVYLIFSVISLIVNTVGALSNRFVSEDWLSIDVWQCLCSAGQ